MRILVVGGAGYIGSHMVKHLLSSNNDVLVADNFSTGYQSALHNCPHIEIDISDSASLKTLLSSQKFDAVFHFASFIQVGESVTDPGKYFANNFSATLTLLQSMVEFGIQNFIFSSTAAVYGDPAYTPIDESHPKNPINPYGRSKWMVEQALEDFDRAHGLRSVTLRYFNAAGADPAGHLGERHEPETHLIPLILQAAAGRRSEITIFGRDYPTPDGTCIRDYIHVTDLVDAHARALDYLVAGGSSAAFNLGNGSGFSVQEVITTAQAITGKSIPTRNANRRDGDPAKLIADATKARNVLGWQPKHSSLEQIIADAWAWEQKYPWHE